MAQLKINDRRSFRSWLHERPAFDDFLAVRIGLRVFPLWARAMKRDWAIASNLSALPMLRILLIKSIPNEEATKLERWRAKHAVAAARAFAAAGTAAAADAILADDAAGAVDAAIIAVAFASTSAYSKRSIWAAVSVDALALQSGQDVTLIPLWHDMPPNWWAPAIKDNRAIWAKDPDTWAFWVRWWDGVIAGKPLPIDLQRDVALIEDEVWQQGPKAVAEAIRAIERAREDRLATEQQPVQGEPTPSINTAELDRAIDATQTGSEIVLNVDTGKLREEPLSDLPTDHLQDALDFMRDAAEVFNLPPDGNDTYAMIRPEIALLDAGIARYAARPWQLYSLCQRVLDRVDKKIAIGDLPKNDPLIDDLRGLLAKASAQLHQFDPKVRESIAANVQFGDPQIDGAQADLLIDAADTIGQIAEEFLAEDAPEVARVLADPNATPAARKEALLITSGRILRSYALATGRGVVKVYKGGRVVLSETAGIAKDVNEITKAGAAISAAVFIIIALLG